ncbi:hypothetical protein FQR65_LT16305 [Abscondita terminalis]|nr:hypothetical protein FQR65_LT16305 [Abscondita terminalis]
MNEKFGLSKKIVLGAATFFAMNMVNAQSVAQGINDIDGYKFGKAKEVYTALVNKEPSDANYFYLGNAYLVQSEPDFEKATEYFTSMNWEKEIKPVLLQNLSQIAKDSRERDPEVLYRIGEALVLYPNYNDPKLSIEYLNKATNLAEKKGVPEYYYYTLGDANRLNKNWGEAMNAYDRALEVAKNKAAVYTRIESKHTDNIRLKTYNNAKASLETFLSQSQKSRTLPSDAGLEGLILAGISKDTKDNALLEQAKQKVAIAKAAKDETFDWDTELAVASGTAPKVASAEGGPTNPAIEALKKQIEDKIPKNTDLLYKLANSYQEVQNWGAGALAAYQKYIDVLATKPAAEQAKGKELLSISYYNMASLTEATDKNKALELSNKSFGS